MLNRHQYHYPLQLKYRCQQRQQHEQRRQTQLYFSQSSSIVSSSIHVQQQSSICVLHEKSNNNDNREENEEGNNNNNRFGLGKFFDVNLYSSEIPDNIRDKIYDIESKTPAANGRSIRITTYTIIAIVTIGLAFFNAFISDLKTSIDPELPSISDAGFTWVIENPITSFLFTNKVGGILLLATGGISGLLAESEMDSRRINSEKIYLELKRRKDMKDKGKGSTTTAAATATKQRSKKSKSKETKRIIALAEVLDSPPTTTTTIVGDDEKNQFVPKTKAASSEVSLTKIGDNIDKSIPSIDEEINMTTTDGSSGNNSDSLLDKVKSFYQRADQMAASQALLLNKELEDRGLLEKITDDSGLRVIGNRNNNNQAEEVSTDTITATTTDDTYKKG
jgi:hypothetical protein